MKTFDFSLKRADPDAGTFSGYASIFGNVDRGGDIVEPDAFKEIIRNGAGEVVTLWQHDQWSPIGSARVAQDEKGLRVEGQLVMADPKAVTALAHIKAGTVDGMSIGYDVLPDGAKYSDGVVHLTKLRLWEVSIVTFPMNPKASVISAKSAMACESVGELEDLLRDALALPRRRAKRLASIAWPIISDGGDQHHDSAISPEVLEAMARDLDSLNDFLKGKRS